MTNQQTRETATEKNHNNRIMRWAFIIAGFFAALIIMAFIAIHIIVDADFVEDRLNGRVIEATDGYYSLELESIRFSILGGSVQAANISLIPDQQKLQQSDSIPALRYEIDIPGISLSGMSLWKLLNDAIVFESLVISNPLISLMLDRDLQEDPENDVPASIHDMIASGLPEIDVGELSIENATVALWQQKDGETSEEVIENITLVFENIRVNTGEISNRNRIFFSDDVRLSVHDFRRFSRDSIYQLDVGSIEASTRAANIHIHDVSILPTITDNEFVDRLKERESRFMFTSETIVLDNLDYWRLVEDQDFIAGAVTVETFMLDVFTDIGVPRTEPTKLPHENLQAAENYLLINEVTLGEGHIVYSERAPEGARPGMIALQDVFISLMNLTNDPELISAETPASVNIEATLAGQGEFNALIELPLLDPELPVIFRGNIGEMNADAFNSLLVDLEGVRIRSGIIDSVMFDIGSQNDHATGTVQIAYRELEVETLDMGDYTRNFGNQIETFVANNLLIPSNSIESPEDTLRTGRVDYEMDRMEDSFLNFLVEALLSGLISSIAIF